MAAADTSSSPSKARLPDFQLLCMQEKFSDAFNEAVEIHFLALKEHTDITVHNCSLRFLEPDLRFDAVVSPANSYGRVDGAFDDALAKAYGGPDKKYEWLTQKAQKVLYDQWKGFAPPGTCTVVRLDHGTSESAAAQPATADLKNPWGTEYLLLCPTMRVPRDVRWDREVVYECVWSLLCAVDNHNRKLRAGGGSEGEREIKNILMTPLATGCGLVTPDRWAKQCVIAMKHWVDAVQNPHIWANMDWNTIEEKSDETSATYADGT